MAETFSFKAAIFDLDGTLLDSLGVWARVDDIFFGRRGLPLPADYGPALSGMSFLQAAVYTKERFALPEEIPDILSEWSDIAREEYALHVELKSGAAAYVRALKRAGVRLAVATMLPDELSGPCLRRHGLYGVFDAICSSHERDGNNKLDGALFREAARQLGAAPEDCVVFDDVLEGVRGARNAGMRAVCVQEAYSAHAAPERAADRVIARWSEAPLPEGAALDSPRCVIFTAYCEGDLRRAYVPAPGDFLLAADGGYRLTRRAGLTPDELIGDFDSMPEPEAEALKIARYPAEKDDTDTILCVNRALALGYERMLLVGGVGGRVDHTLANVQTLLYGLAKHARIELEDGNVWMTALRDGEITVPRRPGKLSVFALSERAEGVTLEGVRYPLRDGVLTNDYPLGVSNAFTAEAARVAVRKGALLIVAGSRDRGE